MTYSSIQKRLWTIIAILLCFSFTQAQKDGNGVFGELPDNFSRRVLLKLGDFYLFFSYPMMPYEDVEGNVLVPLRVVGELLGGQVVYDPALGSGTIARASRGEGEQTLSFKGGENRATIGDQAVRLAVTPIWLASQEELLVPLGALTEAFGIEMRWSAGRAFLELRGDGFERFGWFEAESLPGYFRDTEELIPTDLKVRRQGPELRQISFRFDLETMGDVEVEQGDQTVITLAKYKDVGDGGFFIHGRDTAVVTIGPSPRDPCRRAEEVFRCRDAFLSYFGPARNNKPVDFVLARIGLRSQTD